MTQPTSQTTNPYEQARAVCHYLVSQKNYRPRQLLDFCRQESPHFVPFDLASFRKFINGRLQQPRSVLVEDIKKLTTICCKLLEPTEIAQILGTPLDAQNGYIVVPLSPLAVAAVEAGYITSATLVEIAGVTLEAKFRAALAPLADKINPDHVPEIPDQLDV